METKPYILLVEDRADDVELARRALERVDESLDLVVVKDGKQALDFFYRRMSNLGDKGQPKPLFILLDLNVPKLSGLVVLQMLRAESRTRNVPIIIVTASKEEVEQLESESLGASGFIHKPLTTAKLAELVKRYRPDAP
jgi:two-component system, response regulator